MKNKLLLFGVFLSLLICFAATVTDDPIEVITKKLESYVQQNQQEKAYLHLDKPYYAVGDNIWFKAYVVNTNTSELSSISNVLYVELINEKDSVKRIQLPLQNGLAWGDFKLPDTLNEGNYRIRAYTQWMRNAGPNFYFDKTIKIGNRLSNQVFTSTQYKFTKEGEGEKVTSTIVFKDTVGQPLKAKSIAYQVALENKNVTRGRATTDENGAINIEFLTSKKPGAKAGNIIATITLDDRKKVEKVIPVTALSGATDVQFFPEGGHIVQGLPGKIAIKAVKTTGNGDKITGTIINNYGVETGTFTTNKLGMGSFFFTATAGETYTAKVKFADGSEQNLALPKIEAKGYAINVSSKDPSKLYVKVLLTPDLVNKGTLTLVGQRNGTVYFVSKLPTAKPLITANIPVAGLPSGIVQFTLFSADNLPVAERLAFVNSSHDKIDLSVTGLNQKYERRGNTRIAINATNNNKPLEGSFSVAVTNANIVTPDPENESNIFTSLLLTGDLIGYVEKPNYYFLNNEPETRAALDDLLLTQGWRSISWDALNNIPKPPAFMPEQMLKISGTITNNGKPVVKGKVSLVGADGGFFLIDTLSDANGRFSFENLTFRDSTKFLVQARTIKDKKNVKILIDQVPDQNFTISKNLGDVEINVNNSILDYIQQSNTFFEQQIKKGLLEKSVKIEQVTVVADKRALAPNSTNFNGAGNADYVFSTKDMENAVTLSGFLAGKVPNLGINLKTGAAILRRFGGEVAMPVLIDGALLEPEMLASVNVQDMESLEIIISPLYGAVYNTSALLIITTKRGKPTYPYVRYAPGVSIYVPRGYSFIRTFYSPKYDTDPDNRPDSRTTVYWNPQITTDASGKAIFDYFNTDQPGDYRIVIEGIDVTGKIARKVETYKVE